MINRQEMFNKIKHGLLLQNQKCEETKFVENDGVMDHYEKLAQYHYNGLKCAIGFLIPKNEYDADFEDSQVCKGTNIGEYFITKGYSDDDLEFLRRFQRLHDEIKIEDWKEGLKIIANDYNLSYATNN